MSPKPRALSWKWLSLTRVLWKAVRKGQENRGPKKRPVVLFPAHLVSDVPREDGSGPSFCQFHSQSLRSPGVSWGFFISF